MDRPSECPSACLRARPLFVSSRLAPPAPMQHNTSDFIAPVHLYGMTSPKKGGQYEQDSIPKRLARGVLR